MGTITIKSEKTDDLDFLNEMAMRMNLEAEVKPDDGNTGINRMQPTIDYEDTKEGILEGIQQALDEVKLAREGKIKLKTLDELLDEYKH